LYNPSYLVAKLGQYEGFVKDFSIEEFICLDGSSSHQKINNNVVMKKDGNENKK
jgi:hypothetical protein